MSTEDNLLALNLREETGLELRLHSDRGTELDLEVPTVPPSVIPLLFPFNVFPSDITTEYPGGMSLLFGEWVNRGTEDSVWTQSK